MRPRPYAPAPGRIVLLLAAGACLGAGWGADWESIAASAAGVTSIQADFVQEKHLRILARPLVSRGRFSFQKPGALRWEYTSPVKSLLLMADGRVRRFTESDGRRVETAGAAVQAMPVVAAEIARWLGGRFSESPDFQADLVPGQKVVLTPRAPALAGMIQRIELAFDDTPGVIRTVTVVEDRDASTVLTFGDPRLNQALPANLFRDP